jgi:hypothetical protein
MYFICDEILRVAVDLILILSSFREIWYQPEGSRGTIVLFKNSARGRSGRQDIYINRLANLVMKSHRQFSLGCDLALGYNISHSHIVSRNFRISSLDRMSTTA